MVVEGRRLLLIQRPSTPRDEGGWVLPTVMGVLLFLTVISVALLTYVFAGLRLTRASIDSANRVRAIDGAMETGLQGVRSDTSVCANLDRTVQGYRVTCIDDVGSPVDAGATEVRGLKLIAEASDGSVAGQAKVRIIDLVVNSTPRQLSVGYKVEVCDWQLGGKAASKPLKDCAS